MRTIRSIAARVLAALLITITMASPSMAGIITPPVSVTSTLSPRIVQVPSAVSTAWGSLPWTPQTGQIKITDDPVAPYGSIGLTAEQFFDLFSTARSSPSATYYVNVTTGADGNDGLTSGTPVKSCYVAIGKANTANVPSKILVYAGVYPRTNNCSNGNPAPTVDIAMIAVTYNNNDRVVMGTFDQFSAPSADVTYTHTYSYSVTNVDRVVDLTNLDRFGNYTTLTNVATAAIADATPNSWALVSGTIYIHRADGAAVTNTNTRVYRSTSSTMALKTVQTNFFMGGQNAANGFDLEGGDTVGVLSTAYNTSVPSSPIAIVVSNSSLKYDGQAVNTSARCAGIDSIHGIAAFFNVRADECVTDGFNLHHSLATAAVGRMLTVNSSAFNNGLGQTSQNCLTNHDGTSMIDIAGLCRGNHGGSVRSVSANTIGWFIGTIVQDDFGDLTNINGTLPPTAINVGTGGGTTENTTYYLDGVRVNMPSSAYCMYANSGGFIYYRNMLPCRSPAGGSGTITTY